MIADSMVSLVKNSSVIRAMFEEGNSYGSPRQPFARRLHAHLLRRRQPHPSSDLPHGQYASLRRHRRHIRPPVLNLSTQRYLEHLFDAVL